MAQQPRYSVDIPALQPPAHQDAANLVAPVQAPAIAAGQAIASSDLANVLTEQEKLRALHDLQFVTATELGDAVYRTMVAGIDAVSQKAPLAAAPVWFLPAMNAVLQPLNQRLDDLNQRLDDLKQLGVRSWNASAGDGLATPWSIVPFNNGDDPTLAPHNLPALTDLNAVRLLTAHQRNAYLAGFNLAVQGTIAERRAAIARQCGFRGPL